MLNREIYLEEPESRQLVNDGVATVNDDDSPAAQDALRYELRTFVCEGQYARGMATILETFLRNIDQGQQPCVWVSGFFGSGKSHFVKMLRALWTNASFGDGATPRGLAVLPQDIKDALKELDIQGKRAGGLHAASGTLGASASGSPRLALLNIIFKSAGLPSNYTAANFALWLKGEQIYDAIRERALSQGKNWENELANFHVSSLIREALLELRPNIFTDAQAARELLKTQFPIVTDISSDGMLQAIRASLQQGGKFPLTLIVLDEMQQYIGGNSDKSFAVQEMVEALSKNFQGRLLFIGTGQTAITGTPNLKRLEGRFTQRVELSDADVDSVIRKVILAKKPAALPAIEAVLEKHSGEITRHLASSGIRHRREDNVVFCQDYPLLPVRRRFWENTLRILDQTGTDSQLRNQLSLANRVIRENQDENLGHVCGADYIYFDLADRLQQTGALPRSLYSFTARASNGSPEERLTARACALIFILNKLAANPELGLVANVDTLADLLVEDLNTGSGGLRAQLPALLDQCDQLDKIGDEYHIRTAESANWNNGFAQRTAALSNESVRIDSEREERIQAIFREIAGPLAPVQGDSRVSRQAELVFDSQLGQDAGQKLTIWVRHGWNVNESSVEADARQAGSSSPIIFVFIPRRDSDELRKAIIDQKAAAATLVDFGAPASAEGKQARAAMESRANMAMAKIRRILEEAIAGCRIFQGGGNEITASNPAAALQKAMLNSLLRLYPQFAVADNPHWDKVYDRARRGDPDALKAVGEIGEPEHNAVCRLLLAKVGAGRKGAEIRQEFMAPPYGWSQDAVDGALLALLATGKIRGQAENGQNVAAQGLERKSIGKTVFRTETATVSMPQRIAIRKLMQKLALQIQQGEELGQVDNFLARMTALADRAGGSAPRPERPDCSFLDEIRKAAGNSRLLAVYDRREQILRAIEDWTAAGDEIDRRMPTWNELKRLCAHASSLEQAKAILAQIGSIESQRALLAMPDPLAPLLGKLAQVLREELNRLAEAYADGHAQGMAALRNDVNWQKLDSEQRNGILAASKLDEKAKPLIDVSSNAAILGTLERDSLSSLANGVAALPSRFAAASREAAELNEPQTQFVALSRALLKNEAEIDAWLAESGQKLRDALKKGPVMPEV